jgi:hypothetical protein
LSATPPARCARMVAQVAPLRPRAVHTFATNTRPRAREADDGGKNGDGTICTVIELLGFFGNDEGMAIALRKLLDGGEATFRLEPGSATLISVTLA